jgi:type I restriction enzyme, S subunit
MASDWQSVALGDLYDFNSGLSKPRSAFGSGFPFLSFTDVFYNVFVPQSLGELVNSTEHERETRSIKRGDVFLTRTSETKDELGMSSVALQDIPEATFNGFTKRLRPKSRDVIVPEYAGYFFRSPVFRAGVTAMSSLSTRASLNNEMLARLTISYPGADEQKAIAHVLKSFDDKVELNKQTNETLEAIARALFTSWFVDFEPVHAKVEGRDPGLPERISALFPNSFEHSELGELPSGWRVGTLGDVLVQRIDRCEPSPDTAAHPYVPIDCISSKSLFLATSKPGGDAQSSLTRFAKGDLLFGAMRPYFHKVCIAPFDGTTRTTVFVLSPKVREDFSFATLQLHRTDTVDYATRHSTGTTIPYAVWNKSLQDMPVVVPPPTVRKAFDLIVRPLLERIPEPYFENMTLAALRDVLLPKLVSGQLRLSAVERILKRAV